MKKIIAILLILVIALFSFAACSKDKPKEDETQNNYKPMEEFNEDKLKETWTAGEITFPNGNKITIPCTVGEFIEKSGLKTNAASQYENKSFKAGETFSLTLIGDDVQVKISCKNTSSDDVKYLDATVVSFNFFNGTPGNRQITVAAGLTVGITRADVESALGIPEGESSEDRMYTYKAEIGDEQKIRLSVSFNSSDIVNSISYKLDN